LGSDLHPKDAGESKKISKGNLNIDSKNAERGNEKVARSRKISRKYKTAQIGY
jgi:hypothetical protein